MPLNILQHLIYLLGRTTLFMLIISLVACTVKKQPEMVEVVATPLSDLNLVRAKIPSILLIAKKKPYAVPSDQSCSSLNSIIANFDKVLGPDIDVPEEAPNQSDTAEKVVTGTFRRTVQGLVPFRSWLRRLTGAERYSQFVKRTIDAGIVRRAFIKGLRTAKDCPKLEKKIPTSKPETEDKSKN